MKKLFFFNFILISGIINGAYATTDTTVPNVIKISTGTTLTTGTGQANVSLETSLIYLQSSLNFKKEDLLKILNDNRNAITILLQNTRNTISQDTYYNLLNSLSKFDKNKYDKNMDDKFFALKTDILQKYNDTNFNLLLIKEKAKDNLIPANELQISLNNLNSQVDNYFKNNKVIIDNYLSESKNTIQNFQNEYNTVKADNLYNLQKIDLRKKSLDYILLSYKEFDSLVKNINNLYTLKYDTINAFLSEVKKVSADYLRSNIDKEIENYNSKNPNLKLYTSEINNLKDSLISLYAEKINKKFESFKKDFYSQEDYDFITKNVLNLKQIYYSNDQLVNQTLIDNDSIDQYYTKLKDKMSTVNTNIRTSLKDLNDSINIQDLQNSLRKQIDDFYASEQKNIIDMLRTNLNNYLELLKYKTKEELDNYKNLIAQKQSIDSLSGVDTYKLNQIKNAQLEFEKLSKNALDPKLKDELDKKFWQIELEKIDLQINIDNLKKYNNIYKNIDNILSNTLQKIYQDKNYQGNPEQFKQKLLKTIFKIDTFLKDPNLPAPTKFILLKIKKSIISYVFLK